MTHTHYERIDARCDAAPSPVGRTEEYISDVAILTRYPPDIHYRRSEQCQY